MQKTDNVVDGNTGEILVHSGEKVTLEMAKAVAKLDCEDLWQPSQNALILYAQCLLIVLIQHNTPDALRLAKMFNNS